MSNALIKAALLSISLIAISCVNTKRSHNEASQLLEECRQAMQSQEYEQAMLLLDSIDRAYPNAVEIRKEAQTLRPMVLEQLTLQQLNENDRQITELAILGDSLAQTIETKKNEVESYFVAKGTMGIDVSNATGLHGRLSPQYSLYAVATCPTAINAKYISVRAGNSQVSSPLIPYDGERNRRNSSHQTITFTEAEIDTIASFISSHLGDPIEITFHGDKSWSQTLDSKQAQQFDNLYRMSQAVKRDNYLRLERQRLERQLHTVRTQIARTAKD